MLIAELHRRLVDSGAYANYSVTTCAAYDKTKPPADRSSIDLRANLRAVSHSIYQFFIYFCNKPHSPKYC